MIEVDQLSKAYGSTLAIKNVSFKVEPGEILGFLGPNGAGKTTCFSMIAGLIKSDSGNLEIDGYEITNLPMYRRARLGISYLPQESSIFRWLNVAQNIMSILEIAKYAADSREKRLEELLAEFSISHLKYTPAMALSGGERRRVEIARILALEPEYILLDEPLAGVDPVAVADIKNLIFHLKDKDIGILITDHNVKELLDIVDRAYIIYDGKVLMEGKPKEVIASEKVREVYLGDNFAM